jgi:hypothetical protein
MSNSNGGHYWVTTSYILFWLQTGARPETVVLWASNSQESIKPHRGIISETEVLVQIPKGSWAHPSYELILITVSLSRVV